MATYRLQVSFAGDTAFPRDRMVISPHFSNTGGVLTDDDVGGLVDDLATALSAWVVPVNGREVTVKAYNAEGAPPHLPLATAVRNAGLAPASGVNREVALTLSFYSGINAPRRRGRLYIPMAVIQTTSAIDARPQEGQTTKVGSLAAILAGLGGVDVDWVVYSRADGTARPVTNWWVDDEWDVQRRRGLRATGRLTGTTTEGDLP